MMVSSFTIQQKIYIYTELKILKHLKSMKFTLDQALQKGIEAHKAGKAQQADQYYTAIIKAQPKHPDANHNMGVLAVGVGKVQEALPFFRTALESNPKVEQFWLSYIDALLKLERLTDANGILNQATGYGFEGTKFNQLKQRISEIYEAGSVAQPEVLFNKASTLRDNGNLDNAINLLRDGLNQFPEDTNLLALLSHCYILNDELENAAIQLNKAREIDPTTALVSWNEVRLLIKRKCVDEAVASARKAIERFPNDVEGMGVLGSCLRSNGDIGESLKFLNKAIELNPAYAEALINRGLIRLAEEDKVRALADLEKAHQVKPYITQIWELLINPKIEVKQYSEAITLLMNMIQIDPNHEKIIALLAICNQKTDDKELAIKGYMKVLEFKPEDAHIHVDLGITQARLGKTEKAIESFKKALSLKPDYAQAYNNMGNALQHQGKLEEAIRAYNKTLAIKPDYAEACNNLGNALRNQGKLEEAIQAYKKTLAIKPGYAEAHNNIGTILRDQGKF